MSAEVIPFPGGGIAFEPKRVEICRGTVDSRPTFLVSYIEGDEDRCVMWDGADYSAALQAAAECAACDGTTLPIVDRVNAEALATPADVKRELVEEARMTFDDEVAAELSDLLGDTPENTTKH